MINNQAEEMPSPQAAEAATPKGADKEQKFSCFRSCTVSVKYADLSSKELLRLLKKDTDVVQKTKQARELLAKGDKDGYGRMKREKFEAFTPNAYFESKRGKNEPYSLGLEYMGFDWDHILREKIPEMKDLLISHPIVSFICESLSGEGIHVLVRVKNKTDENFTAVYRMIGEMLSLIIGYNYDPACNDVARLFIISHDADAKCKMVENPFDAEKWYRENQKQITLFTEIDKQSNTKMNERLDKYLDAADLDARMIPGQRHSTLLACVNNLNRAGFDRAEVKVKLTSRYEEPDFTSDEIGKIVDYVYDHNSADFGINNRNNGKGQNGQKGQKRQDVPNSSATSEMVDEEDYFAQVHVERPDVTNFRDKLPKLLQEAIDESKPGDIQWAELLTGMSVFSAMPLDLTFWEEDECGVQFSVMWYGESSSGKGRIKEARDFFKFYERGVRKEQMEKEILPSQEALKKYEQCIEEYKEKKKEDKKAECNCGEKPVVPTAYTLLVSPNTSESQLIKRLSMNDPYTTVRIVEEIGTINDKSKKDYGPSKSNLRGGLEGGAMDVDYKSGSYGVEHARLVDIVAGTPAANQEFLDNQEDGLYARYIYLPLDEKSEYRRLSPHIGRRNKKFWMAMENRIDAFRGYCCQSHRVVKFDKRVMDIIEDELELLNNAYAYYGNPAFISYIRRFRKFAMKMCCILEFMKAYDNNMPVAYETKENPYELSCSVEIAELVTSWISYLIYAACRIISPLKKNKVRSLNKEDYNTHLLYKKLGCVFTTQQCMAMAGELGINERTARRRIKKWCDSGKIVKISQGVFRKVECLETLEGEQEKV